VHAGMALTFMSAWAFIVLDVRAAIVFWAVEGICLLAVARFANIPDARSAGFAPLILSLAANVMRLGSGYDVDRLLLNVEAATLLAQIAALYVVAALTEKTWSSAATVAAHVLTLTALSLEAKARLAPLGSLDIRGVDAV
jgi:hypothetical protein